ncbi:hypothetical protein RFI_13783 [Reticulomyxa filosa]|uniref:Transmembrane protein n=1 Tax=Reticulomyxa filosa TaxID=46433 RepID=X6NCC3_RETFI|nr:hypothetical protein RFI_13783 [Reticulomyxa filosa]|eukprot:ETO23399.1 hypothetical protein RFI_13783 [Reticulomyxa filosa]
MTLDVKKETVTIVLVYKQLYRNREKENGKKSESKVEVDWQKNYENGVEEEIYKRVRKKRRIAMKVVLTNGTEKEQARYNEVYEQKAVDTCKECVRRHKRVKAKSSLQGKLNVQNMDTSKQMYARPIFWSNQIQFQIAYQVFPFVFFVYFFFFK